MQRRSLVLTFTIPTGQVCSHFPVAWALQYPCQGTTLPALLVGPSTYGEDGFPNLWELPGQGWHENLLKCHNLADRVQRILAWPPQFPEVIPQGPVKTPEEESAFHRIFAKEGLNKSRLWTQHNIVM